MILLLIAAFGLWRWRAPPDIDPSPPCFGFPRPTRSPDIRHGAVVLRNAGFTVGYSEFLGNPIWVAYELSAPTFPPPTSRPEGGFQLDARSLRAVEPDAFSRTGYQRGHLAPNYAMYRVYGPDAQRDSFRMTNVSPQRPSLNQKAWQRLEEAVMDHLLTRNGPLCVLTGPVFGPAPEVLPSGVAVPAAFYKILVSARPQPRALAFIIPQNVEGTEPLDGFVVTVDEVEDRTGLDFLHELDDPRETAVEHAHAGDWGLQSVAHLPPRY